MDAIPSQRQTSSGNVLSSLSQSSSSLLGASNRDQQIEKLLKEVKQLKQRVDIMDKENIALKKSIYDLSARYAASISQGGLNYRPGPFVMDPSNTTSANSGVITKAQEILTKAVQQAGGDIDSLQTVGYHDTRDGKPFQIRDELKGHTGAVYCVEFSPNGDLLATGSFDKTVRLWEFKESQKEIFCLKSHTLNISDLAWTPDSNTLLSGSYDETCKTWDVQTGKLLTNTETEGFVQCVAWDFIENSVFYYGTSRKILAMVDSKADEPIIIRNDAMVNTLYASRDGIHVITGDANGILKVWDMRQRKCISATDNDQEKMPITHISIGKRRTDASRRAVDDYDEPRYMAVNSYDNLLRVYDRGMDPPKSKLRQVHTLKGFTNKNWPIKSSFYCGSEYNSSILSRPSMMTNEYGDPDFQSTPSDYLSEIAEPKEEKSVLLATGSADPYAYLYNVGEVKPDYIDLLHQ
ncbi:WD40-repeat-containing domain protein [Halteromyces radiatus]|uniref:WD40-repeat-containing domain protein n=1 Tax=Halteromyces radiatus TaxID=101107 RepID=UPI00221F1E46|nr:WD40-repeat-containing domain protein [Halteromyces radiatus]KAI8078625.1 WD40-repeat-containing domain protein [Halteromyces radiatus]